jgi:hypothetical protein
MGRPARHPNMTCPPGMMSCNPEAIKRLGEAEGIVLMMDKAKRTHKFKLGQSVSLQSTMFNRDAARGAYKVTKQLPERDGEFEYQIKRPGEPHERVVTESVLSTEWTRNDPAGRTVQRGLNLIVEPWPHIPFMLCKPSRSETVASRPFNRRSARPPARRVHWQHGLRRIMSASLLGHVLATPNSATGARRRFWSGPGSSLMNMRREAG